MGITHISNGLSSIYNLTVCFTNYLNHWNKERYETRTERLILRHFTQANMPPRALEGTFEKWECHVLWRNSIFGGKNGIFPLQKQLIFQDLYRILVPNPHYHLRAYKYWFLLKVMISPNSLTRQWSTLAWEAWTRLPRALYELWFSTLSYVATHRQGWCQRVWRG